MALASSGEYPFHLCKVSFHDYYKFTLAFSVKLVHWLAVHAWKHDLETALAFWLTVTQWKILT